MIELPSLDDIIGRFEEMFISKRNRRRSESFIKDQVIKGIENEDEGFNVTNPLGQMDKPEYNTAFKVLREYGFSRDHIICATNVYRIHVDNIEFPRYVIHFGKLVNVLDNHSITFPYE